MSDFAELGDLGTFEIDLEVFEALTPTEQREIVAKLERWKELVKANPLLKYRPHDKQKLYHAIESLLGGFLGGNRSGKTTAGVVDNLIQTIPVEFLPPWLEVYKRHDNEQGPYHCRVVVADLTYQLEQVMLPKIREWCPRDAFYKGTWDKAYNGRLRTLTFADGSTWDFLTHDMELVNFGGAAKHRIHFDEEPPGRKGQEIYDESFARIVDYGGDIRFTMTPLLGLSWTYHLLTDRGRPKVGEDCVTITVDMDDNPHLNPKVKQAFLSGLSEGARAARKSGLFVHFAGLIYPQFDKARHTIPAVDLPRRRDGSPEPDVYVGIDPGINHPTGVVWVAVFPDDRWEVIRSFKLSGATIGQIAGMIHATNEEMKVTPRWYVIDPSARNKNQQTGRSVQMEFIDHGIVTMAGQNDRRAGFNRVRELLERDVDGQPALTLHAGNDELVAEFEEYRWKTNRASEDAGREEPVKINDDIIDALRYVVMSRPHTPDPEAEEEANVPEPVRAFRKQLARMSRRKTGHPVGDGIYS